MQCFVLSVDICNRLEQSCLTLEEKQVALAGSTPAAQNPLKIEFPLVNGLQEPALIGNLVTPATIKFIQMINTGLHWMCISTLFCPIGVIKVYDSLFGKPNIKAVRHACGMLLPRHRGKNSEDQ